MENKQVKCPCDCTKEVEGATGYCMMGNNVRRHDVRHQQGELHIFVKNIGGGKCCKTPRCTKSARGATDF
jgi:hypothetical protein